MLKKIAFAAAGLTLLISPIVVSAQVAGLPDCSSNPTIACLQQEITFLIQILNQLLATRNHTPVVLSTSAPANGNFEVDAGGKVVISGRNFAHLSSVTLGGISMNVTYSSDTQINADVPATLNSGQSYDLVVTTSAGASTPVSINILSVLASNPITVTAPNGGEQWEEGVLNSITWAPYNYNPDINPSHDVDAYLETKNADGTFTNLGSVVPSGKASIHWITGYADSTCPQNPYSCEGLVPPGSNYYIRIVNRVTGAWDRSDAPFTITPKSLNVLVNGSNGPITIAQGQNFSVSWSASSGVTNCSIGGNILTSNGQSNAPVANSGSMTVQTNYGGLAQGVVSLNCDSAPSTDNDPNATSFGPGGGPNRIAVSATVTILQSGVAQPTSTIQVLSPNGGEQIDPTQPLNIRVQTAGLSSISVALYKNDQWQYWIEKQVPPGDKDVHLVTWYTPASSIQGLGSGSNAGAIWKIYATGQKADGSGYVDDKSDAAFSFVNGGTLGTSTLTISIDPQYASFTVAPGTQGVSMEHFDIDATKATEDIRLTKFPLILSNIPAVAGGPSAPAGSLSNCQMTTGNGPLNTAGNTLNPSIVNNAAYTVSFDNPLIIPKGQVTQIKMNCNVGSNATGQYTWNLAVTGQSSFVAVGTQSGSLVPTIIVGGGTHSTIISSSSGTLSVATDSSSPAYRVVAGGTTGVTLGTFRVSASELTNLQKLGLQLGSGSPQDITQVYIYSGSALMGTAVFTGTNKNATTTLTGPLTVNTPVVLTLKADIAGIGTGQAGIPGDLVQINVIGATGTSLNSGATVSENSGPVSTGAGVRIFRSYPTVAQVTLPSTGLISGNNAVLRFSVTATPAGNIGLYKFAINLSGSQASLTLPTLGVYTDPAFSQPVGGFSQNSYGTVYQTSALSNGVFSGGAVTLFLGSSGQALQIPAGGTYYFEIRDAVTPTGSNPAVVTSLSGDSSYQTFINSNGTNVLNSNFFWSPNDNTTSQFSTVDWTNGYSLPGLSASGLSQSRTGSGTVNPPTISISSGTQPPNSLAPQGAIISFTTFTLTNTSSQDVTINSFVVQRSGAGDAALHDVGISYDGGKGVSGSLVNGQATLSGPFGLGAGQSRTYTLVGGMAADLSSYAGQTVSLSLVALNTSTQVSGTLPVVGATYTINTSLAVCPETAQLFATYGYHCEVNVAALTPPTACTISFSPSTITPGQNYTMTWNAPGATSATYSYTLNGTLAYGPTSFAASGTQQGQWTPQQAGVYVLTLTPNVGSACSTSPIVAAPIVHPATPKTVFLTSGTSWTVPSDWNSSVNTIEVIGGGAGSGGDANARGGGGGAYSKAVNVSLTPGGVASYAIGAGGTAAGGDTYFCNISTHCVSLSDVAVAVGAQGASGMTGGQASAGVGSTKYSGGNGGTLNGTCASSGGGGAAGPNGAGGAGGNSSTGCGAGPGEPNNWSRSGAGGGGNGGGSVGADAAYSYGGGAGGNGTSGTTGGSGSSSYGAGGGTNGGGGGGGSGYSGGYPGGAGGNGQEWDTNHGSGAGGGGGGNWPGGPFQGVGGNGGLYGGGGGGSVNAASSVGGQGIIVITYTPATTASASTNVNLANAYTALQGALQKILKLLGQ